MDCVQLQPRWQRKFHISSSLQGKGVAATFVPLHLLSLDGLETSHDELEKNDQNRSNSSKTVLDQTTATKNK